MEILFLKIRVEKLTSKQKSTLLQNRYPHRSIRTFANVVKCYFSRCSQ